MSDNEALKEFNEKFSLNIENTDVKELDFDEKNIRSWWTYIFRKNKFLKFGKINFKW